MTKPIKTQTKIVADSSDRSIHLHDLAILFIASPSVPHAASVFLYLLTLLDKNRRGQIAKVTGRHPMNSDAIGEMLGISGRTVRRTIDHLIQTGLIKYSEMIKPAVDGKPPIKRRLYILCLNEITRQSVKLSKMICRSNSLAVKAKRMKADNPDGYLKFDSGAFHWMERTLRPPMAEGEMSPLWSCTATIYLSTSKHRENKLKGNISVLSPKPAAPEYLSLSPVSDNTSVTSDPLPAQPTASEVPAPEAPARRKVTVAIETELGASAAMPSPPANRQRSEAMKAILAQAREGKLVDPSTAMFEAAARANESRLEEAIQMIRNWNDINGLYQDYLVVFCRETGVYPTRASKAKWVAQMLQIDNERLLPHFLEACRVSVAKANAQPWWSITDPGSIKTAAIDISGRKSRRQWVSAEAFIKEAYTNRGDKSKEAEQQTEAPKEVWISKEQADQLMREKTIKGRAALLKQFHPELEVKIVGDPNGEVGLNGSVGYAVGVLKAHP